MQDTAWYILGAGSIGCLFGACLRRAGVDVTLIARADGAAALRARGGVTLQTDSGSALVAVPGVAAAALAGPVRQLLICTKAHQSAAALASIQPALAADAVLVLLQNGLGVREQLQPLLPQATILHAVSTEGAYQHERFHVVHAGRGHTLLGALDGAAQARAHAAAASLRCELALRAVTDIGAHLWRKLAVNCVINPLSALHGCRNGELLQQPGIETSVAALCAEVSAVAAADGQALAPAALAAAAFEVMRATAANRSSMLQDLEQRRRTEIDFINGHVVALGARFGIDCPANRRLLVAIKAREQALGCR